MDGDENIPLEHSFLELIHWKTLEEWESRDKLIVKRVYETFDEAAEAIDELGAFEICTDRANAFFLRTSGFFEDDIVAIRQSGLNVRRILIRKATFADLYGDFHRCINSVLSNNAIGPEVELAHAQDYAERLELSAEEIDGDRRYDRAEIDVTALLQMLALRDSILSDYEEDATGLLNHVFNIGFTAGRNFSSLQSLMTLEPGARQAIDAKDKNIAKGKASGSDKRRIERLDRFMDAVEDVYQANEALRPYEDMVLRVAFDSVIPPGEYGHGQFASYCTTLRSDEPYKHRFDRIFRN